MTKEKDNKVKAKSPSSMRRTSKTSTRSTRRKEKPGAAASPSSVRKSPSARRKPPSARRKSPSARRKEHQKQIEMCKSEVQIEEKEAESKRSQRSKRRTPEKKDKKETEKATNADQENTKPEKPDAGKPKKGGTKQQVVPSQRRKAAPSTAATGPLPVTSPVVPQALLIDGPAGVPIVVPLDVHDGDGEVVKAVPTLSGGPVLPTPGCLSLHWSGLFQFAPSCTLELDTESKAVFASNTTPGSLTKILGGIAAFIADDGARLPVTPNTKDPKDVKNKLGETVPVSGFIKIDSKSMCHFTRVAPTASCPRDASMGVLVRDKTSGCLFFVPTEGRTVGPMLRAGAKLKDRKAPQGSVLGLVVRENSGLLAFRAPSEGRDGLVGYVMGSPTGVPIFFNSLPPSTVTAMPHEKKEEQLPTEEEIKAWADQAAEAGKKAEAELKEADDKAAAERATEMAKKAAEKMEYQKHLYDRSKHYAQY